MHVAETPYVEPYWCFWCDQEDQVANMMNMDQRSFQNHGSHKLISDASEAADGPAHCRASEGRAAVGSAAAVSSEMVPPCSEASLMTCVHHHTILEDVCLQIQSLTCLFFDAVLVCFI